MMPKEWDVFISHASEDKEDFVRPLAQALAQLGVKVWFDEFTLAAGDSLSRSIDKGLAGSSYGLVIVSESFIAKKWPARELRGLVAREIQEEQKVILPIWHGISHQRVLEFSPPLADTIALKTSELSAEEMAIAILKVVRPDIYNEHPRSDLEAMVNGKALQQLQDELEHVKEELAQYQCPWCEAPLVARNEVEIDADMGVSGMLERFECGHTVVDGSFGQLCPSDSRFPKFEEFELDLRQEGDVWICFGRPKTKMAQYVHLLKGIGRTEDEAKERLLARYNSVAEKWKP